MAPTDDKVSRRPQTVTAANGEFVRTRRWRGRSALVALTAVLALAVPAPALAQTSGTGTSGYNQKPPTPKTTPEPKSGTAPSKEATTPSKEEAPSTAPEPTATTPAKSVAASKLPFTGLDLRWVVGAGALLLAGGLSLRVLQRRSAGH